MSYQVFARKYRPQNFDEVVGQTHVTRTLKNAIEQKRLAHAYLFVGPRGTGKTSTARILAKALNCETGMTTSPCGVCAQCREIAEGRSLNVLEFDAASNTQVDKVRELIIDNVKYAPASGRYKMYIVDEVHMLSNSSFNALLKTLEEPPPHVIFVFATTDPQKVPLTIISRCQRFDLGRIAAPLIEQHLKWIAGKEKITLQDAAAEAIARGAEGGLRDAESMLDQLVAFCGTSINEEDVLNVFGFTAQETVTKLCGAILGGECGEALRVVQQQAEKGKDLGRLMADVIAHLRDLLVMKADAEGLRGELAPEAFAVLEQQAGGITTDRLLELIEQFAAAENRMKWAPNKKLHLEIAVIKAVQTLEQATLTEILDALAVIRGGGEVKLPERKPPAPPVAASVARPAAPVKAPAAPEAPMAPEAAVVKETPESAPVVAAPASVDAGTLWKDLMVAVRRDRPLILTWLEKGALVEAGPGIVKLGFPPEQSMAMESLSRPNNRGFLENLLAQLTGEKRQVICEAREGLVVEPVSLPAPPAEPAPPDPMEEFKNDPLIRKALEIFQAEIQPA